MYGVTHPDFTAKQWHVFVTYLASTWIACLTVCFFNNAMPYLNQVGIFFILAGFLITIIVVYAHLFLSPPLLVHSMLIAQGRQCLDTADGPHTHRPVSCGVSGRQISVILTGSYSSPECSTALMPWVRRMR